MKQTLISTFSFVLLFIIDISLLLYTLLSCVYFIQFIAINEGTSAIKEKEHGESSSGHYIYYVYCVNKCKYLTIC